MVTTPSNKARSGPTWTADRRLYLTKDGKVVEKSDPNRHTLLVNTGGVLPMVQARKLGLVTDEPAPNAESTPDPHDFAVGDKVKLQSGATAKETEVTEVLENGTFRVAAQQRAVEGSRLTLIEKAIPAGDNPGGAE